MHASWLLAIVIFLCGCSEKSPDHGFENCQCDSALPGIRFNVKANPGCSVVDSNFSLTIGKATLDRASIRCGTSNLYTIPFFLGWPTGVVAGDAAHLDYFGTGNGVEASGTVDFNVESTDACQVVTLVVECTQAPDAGVPEIDAGEAGDEG